MESTVTPVYCKQIDSVESPHTSGTGNPDVESEIVVVLESGVSKPEQVPNSEYNADLFVPHPVDTDRNSLQKPSLTAHKSKSMANLKASYLNRGQRESRSTQATTCASGLSLRRTYASHLSKKTLDPLQRSNFKFKTRNTGSVQFEKNFSLNGFFKTAPRGKFFEQSSQNLRKYPSPNGLNLHAQGFKYLEINFGPSSQKLYFQTKETSDSKFLLKSKDDILRLAGYLQTFALTYLHPSTSDQYSGNYQAWLESLKSTNNHAQDQSSTKYGDGKVVPQLCLWKNPKSSAIGLNVMMKAELGKYFLSAGVGNAGKISLDNFFHWANKIFGENGMEPQGPEFAEYKEELRSKGEGCIDLITGKMEVDFLVIKKEKFFSCGEIFQKMAELVYIGDNKFCLRNLIDCQQISQWLFAWAQTNYQMTELVYKKSVFEIA
jgi:hypothetical protein